MAQYATRTCYFCGRRESQPYMSRRRIRTEVGRSQASISGSTAIGFFAGSKAAERAVERAVFRTSERTYTRKRDVWVCQEDLCHVQAKVAGQEPEESWSGTLVTGAVLLIVFGVFFGGGDDAGNAGTASLEAPGATISDSPQFVELSPGRFTLAGQTGSSVPGDGTLNGIEDELTRSLASAMAAEVDAEVVPAVTDDMLRLIEAEFRGADAASRRLLQSALAKSGTYEGDLDGAWGPGTSAAFRSALERYIIDYPSASDVSDVADARAFFDKLLGF